MKLVKGSQARTTGNLKIRTGPGTNYTVVATLRKGVLVQLVNDPAEAWAEVEANGHTADGKTIYSEPHAASSVEATRGIPEWKLTTLQGHVAVRYLQVTDGPE